MQARETFWCIDSLRRVVTFTAQRRRLEYLVSRRDERNFRVASRRHQRATASLLLKHRTLRLSVRYRGGRWLVPLGRRYSIVLLMFDCGASLSTALSLIVLPRACIIATVVEDMILLTTVWC